MWLNIVSMCFQISVVLFFNHTELRKWFKGEVSDYLLLKLSKIKCDSLPSVVGISESDLQDVYSKEYGRRFTRYIPFSITYG